MNRSGDLTINSAQMNARKIIYFLSFLFLGAQLSGQKGIVNKGALIVVANNGIINIKGTGAAYTNQSNGSFHGRITLDGKIYLDGNWTNNATSGNVLLSPGTNGEVIFDGPSAQIIGGSAATSFEKLTINNASGVSLQSNISVFGNLGLTSGNLNIGSNIITLAPVTAIAGTPTASNMIIASGTGEVRKLFTGIGSFTFPVGDNTGTLEYSPASINFTSGTFNAGAYASVKLVNSKYPANNSASNYLNRYWTLNQYNISNFSCALSFNYVDADIAGTESAIYLGQYTAPYWTKLNITNTATNTLTGTVNSFSDFTGGQISAFDPAVSMNNPSVINESAENGATINVTLFNSSFQPSLNPANWSLTNLPQGVSIGNIARVDNSHATITLSGNRTKDYDSNIANATLNIGYLDLINVSSGTLSANTGVTFTANNDPESLILSGSATEHAESGTIVTVTLAGGTFASSLNTSNWVLTNLPTGVTKGTLKRVSSTVATISLSGNAPGPTDAYGNANITNLTLTIQKAEIDDNSDIVTSLSVNTGFTFINVDESLIISMSGSFNESSENIGVITVTSSKPFVNSLTPANWTLTNLPQGVSTGTITRIDSMHVTIALNGTRTKDYDSNITNLMLQIKSTEIKLQATDATITTGVTFVANNDAESLAMSAGAITEAAENGKTINVTLAGGTFASSLTLANWSFTNLPPGVTIGNVSRTDMTHAVITLSGNRIQDYDSNIGLNLSVSEIEIDDYTGVPLTCNTGAILTAVNDPEVLTISDNGDIVEDSENGKIITVNLTGGTFANPLTPANWALTNMPAGVSIGSISRVSATQATITLSGNTTIDYDVNITNVTLTVASADIFDTSGPVTVSSGVTFKAIDEPVTLILSDNGINESSENGRSIFVKVSQDRFIASPTLANWQFTNLPTGVTIGNLSEVDSTHVTLTLSGNRIKDYDSDLTNFTVQIPGTEFKQHHYTVSANSGVTFVALNDPESLSMTGTITEGSENGSPITVTLTGGTFAPSLTPANWIITGQPSGVSIGNLVRNSATQVTVSLSGNSNVYYANDITNMQLAVNELEIDDYTSIPLTINTGVTFKAVQQVLSIVASTSGNIIEGRETGRKITVTLSGGTFISAFDPANWSVSNLPAGVTIGNITEQSSTIAIITLSGNRIIDYDADITNASVQINSAEFTNYTGGNLSTSGGILFKANNEQLTISNGSLIENKLNGAVIGMTLSQEYFATANLNTANYILNNAPAGLTVASVNYVDSTHATLVLAYDSVNFDFDTDIPNFSLRINAPELGGVAPVVSNNVLYITAIVENVQVILADSSLIENKLNNAEITIKLVNERIMNNVPSTGDFTLNGAPAGLNVQSVNIVAPDSVQLTLSFNGTDFDADYNVFNVTISGTILRGGKDVISNNVTITAIIEVPQLTILSQSLVENSLNGSSLLLSLVNDKFAGTILDNAGFILNNAPAGLTIGTVSFVDSVTAHLILAFDSTDFDADSTHFSLTIKGSELAGNADLLSNELTITAVIEPSIIQITGLLNEKTLNGDTIHMILKNVNFVSPVLSKQDFLLNNSPSGISIDTVIYVDPTHALIRLAYDNTDFDVNDSIFAISVDPILLSGVNSSQIQSNSLLITAVIETQTAIISHSGLTEANLNGALVTLDLVNETFALGTPNKTDFSIFNVPQGTSLDTVIFISSSQAELKLKFNGPYFKQDYTNFHVLISSAELTAQRSIVTNSLTIATIVQIGSLTIANPGLNKSTLNGARIELDITGVTFLSNRLNSSSYLLNNAPAGVSIDSVVYDSATRAYLYIHYDGTDYSADINNFTITVLSSEITGQLDLISNQLTILSTDLALNKLSLDIKIQSWENMINIRCDQFEELNGIISVYNLEGQEIMNKKLSPSPINSFSLHVPSGNYLVRIINKQKIYNGKVYITAK